MWYGMASEGCQTQDVGMREMVVDNKPYKTGKYGARGTHVTAINGNEAADMPSTRRATYWTSSVKRKSVRI